MQLQPQIYKSLTHGRTWWQRRLKGNFVCQILHEYINIRTLSGQQIEFEEFGVIVDGGRKCYLKGIVIYNIEKITDEEFDAMEKDYDPFEAPPGPYKI